MGGHMPAGFPYAIFCAYNDPITGVTDTCAPKIITANTTAEVDERLDGTVFTISGVLANEMTAGYGSSLLPCLRP